MGKKSIKKDLIRNLPADFIKTAKICSIDHLAKANQGYFYVEKNRVLSSYAPRGIEMLKKETHQGVEAEVRIKKGVKLQQPLFFCFGILDEKEEQFIVPNIILEDDCWVKIVAHCSFPRAKEVSHKMKAIFKIGQKSVLEYEEHHYHGENSGSLVMPKLKVEIDKGGTFLSNFLLTKGTVGKVDIELEAYLKKNAKTRIETKVLGKGGKDSISITDKVYLVGENSRSLIKMRAAAKDGGRVFMQGETYAKGNNSQGHVDCQEIVSGKGSVAQAVPIVKVSNDSARVTHEASVGKINQKELEALMTRGLSEDEAAELIIEAMMK